MLRHHELIVCCIIRCHVSPLENPHHQDNRSHPGREAGEKKRFQSETCWTVRAAEEHAISGGMALWEHRRLRACMCSQKLQHGAARTEAGWTNCEQQACFSRLRAPASPATPLLSHLRVSPFYTGTGSPFLEYRSNSSPNLCAPLS